MDNESPSPVRIDLLDWPTLVEVHEVPSNGLRVLASAFNRRLARVQSIAGSLALPEPRGAGSRLDWLSIPLPTLNTLGSDCVGSRPREHLESRWSTLFSSSRHLPRHRLNTP